MTQSTYGTRSRRAASCSADGLERHTHLADVGRRGSEEGANAPSHGPSHLSAPGAAPAAGNTRPHSATRRARVAAHGQAVAIVAQHEAVEPHAEQLAYQLTALLTSAGLRVRLRGSGWRRSRRPRAERPSKALLRWAREERRRMHMAVAVLSPAARWGEERARVLAHFDRFVLVTGPGDPPLAVCDPRDGNSMRPTDRPRVAAIEAPAHRWAESQVIELAGDLIIPR